MKKKNLFRALLFIGTVISLFYVPWPILKAWLPPLPSSVQEQVEDVVDMGFDGIVVYVEVAGEAPIVYTAGLHSRQDSIPAKPEALFKLASISKLYRALAVTKMASRGLLSMDDKLTDFFPELSGRIQFADEITVKMLIQHRSGIPNYTDTEGYWLHPKSSSEENLALVLDLPAQFPPDSDYEYCNTNYLLLGEIMDKVLGHPHSKFIQSEILDPLQLNHTYFSLEEVDMEDVMSGYHVGYEEDLKYNRTGMMATAEDVGKFIRALNNGKAFQDDEERSLYSSLYPKEHTGLVPGFQSIAKYIPEIDAVVVQFTSTTNFRGYNWNLSEISWNRIVDIIEDHHEN
ncbi:MAG: class A beta-lactamase-related serine hydrolase [Bacteroidetes bacterium]|nr:MAG: class A beta-lactamase-related serine hydrolase [Bacteroidota bacterium]